MINKLLRKRSMRRGMALILSLFFAVLFSSLTIGMFNYSSTNLQVADNQVQANRARYCAESGLDILKHYMSQIRLYGIVNPSTRFTSLASQLSTQLTTEGYAVTSGISGIQIGSEANPIVLDSQNRRVFWAQVYPVNNDIVQVAVVGQAGTLQRLAAVQYLYGARTDSVFNYGVATKGPLGLAGKISFVGVNVAVEADVYIESMNYANALSLIGPSEIAGNVSITNPAGAVVIQGTQAGIGGDTGSAALSHVTKGVPPTQFPYPNTDHFKHYATGDVISSSTNMTASTTYRNARILAGTNPTFSGNLTFEGILLIESPNVVNFGGNTVINGLIVGDGSVKDDSATSQINFLGTVSSQPVTALPNVTDYDALRSETGTFLMAPGFAVSFGGNFDTLNGAIAANGVKFYGNAGGTIAGSVINYSEKPMSVSGSTELLFNRSGCNNIPSGFVSELVLNSNPVTYAEAM